MRATVEQTTIPTSASAGEKASEGVRETGTERAASTATPLLSASRPECLRKTREGAVARALPEVVD